MEGWTHETTINRLEAEVQQLKLQLGEARLALETIAEATRSRGDGYSMNICSVARRGLSHLVEKPVEEAPKRCGSYWDGNQCEGPDGHDGKHCWMGWSWVVSPPPLTEETPTEKRECPACNGRGFLQFLENGEKTTCALCDGNKKV